MNSVTKPAQMQAETSPRVETHDKSDHYSPGARGDLTEKQYAALEKVAQLSPGYFFQVWQYSGGPSSTATHVAIFDKDPADLEAHEAEVALAGHDCAQFYDQKEATRKTLNRVLHRVYRRVVSWRAV